MRTRTPLKRKKPFSGVGAPKRGGKPALKRRGIKRRRRSAEDFARIYGPEERVAWIKAQPCVWCVHRGLVRLPVESENAHVKTGGMGYKADYRYIVPLCAADHAKYDEHRAPFDKPAARHVVQVMAKMIESLWQAHLAAGAARGRTR